MAKSSVKNRQVRLALFVCVLALIGVAITLGLFHRTPWIVPPAEKGRKNPLVASPSNLSTAREIYMNKCANCHGDSGKGDGSDARMYDPAPSDLTDAARVNKLTDGEIYYQITEGRKPMPSFRKRLSDEQRWQLVLLVRTFANTNKGAPAAEEGSEKSESAPKAN